MLGFWGERGREGGREGLRVWKMVGCCVKRASVGAWGEIEMESESSRASARTLAGMCIRSYETRIFGQRGREGERYEVRRRRRRRRRRGGAGRFIQSKSDE